MGLLRKRWHEEVRQVVEEKARSLGYRYRRYKEKIKLYFKNEYNQKNDF